MFATQQYMDAVDAGRKRLRDDEEAAANAGFGEHRNKRIQALPLRNSPRAANHSLSPSVVPLNASPAFAGPQSHLEPCPHVFDQGVTLQQDSEMEMDNVNSSPLDQDELARLPALLADPSTGRMPTPIQPSFAAQVRGQHSGWAASGQNQTIQNGIVNLGHHVVGMSQDESVPRAMGAGADWQILHNNRRLPSPILEMADSNRPDVSDTHGCMMMDAEGQESLAHLDRSSPVHGEQYEQSSIMHAMEHPNAVIDADSQHHLVPYCESDTDPSSPSPGRKGHQRSKHTVNSWTWQPGMKKSFSIGYRSDCEKCRLKVPGHFNHIVIS